MGLFDPQITDCLKHNLEQKKIPIPFSQVWEEHIKNKGRLLGMKKTVAVPLLAVFSLLLLLAVGFSYKALVDKTDYPFVDDPSIIGKWETVDMVLSIDQFIPGKRCFPDLEEYITAVAFAKDGKTVASIEGSKLQPVPITWTKGLVINKEGKTASKYLIKEIDGSTYMFMEWKSGDYTYDHRQPPYYVFKQVDKHDYSDVKLTITVEDKVDYPFVADPAVMGQWKAVDFVEHMDDYKIGYKTWRDDLFLTQMTFAENGQITMFSSEKGQIFKSNTWTKGLVLCPKEKTASKYLIKELEGNTYIFYEWKSGDYSVLGKKPWYYVLQKLE